ncbi:hypothetical protein AGLY_015162 [Aphis glycines]|uniref:Uncharacterized protein n=1 Tax=Aphis glycines TaxID=307491 RepID=A0A6G0T3E3_APHGL|nr:hypothetical protein AGLY_015162 [Aphis glycines]
MNWVVLLDNNKNLVKKLHSRVVYIAVEYIFFIDNSTSYTKINYPVLPTKMSDFKIENGEYYNVAFGFSQYAHLILLSQNIDSTASTNAIICTVQLVHLRYPLEPPLVTTLLLNVETSLNYGPVKCHMLCSHLMCSSKLTVLLSNADLLSPETLVYYTYHTQNTCFSVSALFVAFHYVGQQIMSPMPPPFRRP